jgi:hypothetical protein
MRSIKQLFFRGYFLPGIALCALSLPVNMAQAGGVTFNFSGAVSGVSGALSGPFGALQTLNGSVTFDNVGATSPTGTYHGAISGLTLNFSTPYSASFDSTGSNTINLTNAALGGIDKWRLSAGAMGVALNGFTPKEFELKLEGKDLFANNNLQPPDLSKILSQASWRLIFDDGNELPSVRGGFTHLAAVPLPAAVVLFGAGLISLVGLGAGGLRNLRKSQV